MKKQINISHLREYAPNHQMIEIMEEFPQYKRTSLYRICKNFGIKIKRGKCGNSPIRIQNYQNRNNRIIEFYKNNNFDLQKTSAEFSISKKQIYNILSRSGAFVTLKEINEKKVFDYLKKHKPMVFKIAQNTGLSESCIREILQRYNIKTCRY